MSAPTAIPPGAAALVVDDSAAMRRQLVTALRELLGLSCDEACDGAEAWRKLAAGPYDVVLTDINMPVMDGLKLVSLVRQNDQLRSIPIIIITTEGAEEDRERGLALGANAYISKPIQSSHLIKTIGELLPV
jgi:two-component system chemotaxis response regulator CheY